MQARVKQSNRELTKPVDDEIAKKLRLVLKELNMISNDIEASAVISSDGLVKAAMLGESIDPDRFGAMCATLLALSKRAATETGRGELKLLMIEGTKGTMMVVQIGAKGVLAIAAKPKSKLGMIFLEVKKVSEKISVII
jgi:hypothetical protein